MRRRAMLAGAVLCAAAAVTLWSAPAPTAGAQVSAAARGRALFVSGCANCHGTDGRGVPGRGPSLIGVGARAADFYLRTGRMPLSQPSAEPVRNPPAFDPAERAQLVAYVASAFGGPPIPRVDPAAGDLRLGQREFADNCAGCHAITAKGGVVPGAVAPPLQQATPVEVAEAVRVGPYVMPAFADTQIDQHALDSIARYVQQTHDPPDEGGWGVGNIGPIPEGLVAWVLGGIALLLVCRVIGERG